MLCSLCLPWWSLHWKTFIVVVLSKLWTQSNALGNGLHTLYSVYSQVLTTALLQNIEKKFCLTLQWLLCGGERFNAHCTALTGLTAEPRGKSDGCRVWLLRLVMMRQHEQEAGLGGEMQETIELFSP